MTKVSKAANTVVALPEFPPAVYSRNSRENVIIIFEGHDSCSCCIVWNVWQSPVPRTKERVSRETARRHDLRVLGRNHYVVISTVIIIYKLYYEIFEPIDWAAFQMVERQGYPRACPLEELVEELPPPGRAVGRALSWSPTKRSNVMILRAVPYQHPCAKKSYTTH